MPIVKSTENLDAGSLTLYIETDVVPLDDPTSVYDDLETRAEARKLLRTAHDVFGEGLDLARDCAVKVKDSLNKMQDSVRPDEFELQLAIKLDTEVGVPMLTKLGAEAQVQVTMRWASSVEGG